MTNRRVILTIYGDNFTSEHSKVSQEEKIFPLGPLIRKLKNWSKNPYEFIERVSELNGKYPIFTADINGISVSDEDLLDIDSLVKSLDEIAATSGVVASIKAGCSYCTVKNTPYEPSINCKEILNRNETAARFLQSGLCCASEKGMIANELILAEVDDITDRLLFVPRKNLSVDVRGFKSQRYNKERCIKTCTTLFKYFNFRRDELGLQGRVMIYGLSDQIDSIDLKLVYDNPDRGIEFEDANDWCKAVEAELSKDTFFSRFLEGSFLNYSKSGEKNSFYFVFFVFGGELRDIVWSGLNVIMNKNRDFDVCSQVVIPFQEKEFLEDWVVPKCDLEHWPDVKPNTPQNKTIVDVLDEINLKTRLLRRKGLLYSVSYRNKCIHLCVPRNASKNEVRKLLDSLRAEYQDYVFEITEEDFENANYTANVGTSVKASGDKRASYGTVGLKVQVNPEYYRAHDNQNKYSDNYQPCGLLTADHVLRDRSGKYGYDSGGGRYKGEIFAVEEKFIPNVPSLLDDAAVDIGLCMFPVKPYLNNLVYNSIPQSEYSHSNGSITLDSLIICSYCDICEIQSMIDYQWPVFFYGAKSKSHGVILELKTIRGVQYIVAKIHTVPGDSGGLLFTMNQSKREYVAIGILCATSENVGKSYFTSLHYVNTDLFTIAVPPSSSGRTTSSDSSAEL